MIIESAVEGNLGDALMALTELVRGDQDSELNDVFARIHPKSLFEKAFELTLGNSGLFREFWNRESGRIVLLDDSDHFNDRVVIVFLCELVVLNNTANPFNFAVRPE